MNKKSNVILQKTINWLRKLFKPCKHKWFVQVAGKWDNNGELKEPYIRKTCSKCAKVIKFSLTSDLNYICQEMYKLACDKRDLYEKECEKFF